MRRVVLVAFPEVQSLDVAGPSEVLAAAGGYRVDVVAPTAGLVRASSGLGLWAERRLGATEGPLDALIVAGGAGTRAVMTDESVLTDVRRLAPSCRRVASVCSGAFVLAAAGLLDGRRVTTHWAWCEALARAFPAVTVEPDRIWVRDGDVWTSAGVTAGIDLALAMVEEDAGRDVALAVARQLVVFLKRPGGQSQFSAQLANQLAERQPLSDLQAWIADHLDADLSVERLAGRAAMSVRNFSRTFHREVGVTPARFVERARVDAARRLLEESVASTEAVAARCGFGTAETMRRTFLRALHVTPADYRRRFRAEEETA
ncbi:MAG: GlxA family transcriptional regulator [Acidimicrobiia bacterium]|nr:GlxA family transcriptional regulator [Acidimicrobiia bacterium]